MYEGERCMIEIQEVDPLEVSRRLRAGESLRLVDVRERDEWAVCRIEGAELRPLSAGKELV